MLQHLRAIETIITSGDFPYEEWFCRIHLNMINHWSMIGIDLNFLSVTRLGGALEASGY